MTTRGPIWLRLLSRLAGARHVSFYLFFHSRMGCFRRSKHKAGRLTPRTRDSSGLHGLRQKINENLPQCPTARFAEEQRAMDGMTDRKATNFHPENVSCPHRPQFLGGRVPPMSFVVRMYVHVCSNQTQRPSVMLVARQTRHTDKWEPRSGREAN